MLTIVIVIIIYLFIYFYITIIIYFYVIFSHISSMEVQDVNSKRQSLTSLDKLTN